MWFLCIELVALGDRGVENCTEVCARRISAQWQLEQTNRPGEMEKHRENDCMAGQNTEDEAETGFNDLLQQQTTPGLMCRAHCFILAAIILIFQNQALRVQNLDSFLELELKDIVALIQSSNIDLMPMLCLAS